MQDSITFQSQQHPGKILIDVKRHAVSGDGLSLEDQGKGIQTLSSLSTKETKMTLDPEACPAHRQVQMKC